jgi:hypothetical protein
MRCNFWITNPDTDVGGECTVAQFSHDLVELGLCAGNECNLCALSMQGTGDCLAYALADTSNKCDLAGQFSVHPSLSTKQ